MVPSDYGLSSIAAFLGKSDGVQFALEAEELEQASDFIGAISKYRAAYRAWPALDSRPLGGLPKLVRDEALANGYCGPLLDVIDVQQARASRVVSAEKVLTGEDVKALDALRDAILSTSTVLENNPENRTHCHKSATMMNNAPDYPLCSVEPQIVEKLRRFAQRAWNEGDWSAIGGGPLEFVEGGVEALSIRVAELWEYDVGGGLADQYHYDVDSVLTIVVLLSEDGGFDGGDFSTHECDGSHEVYDMDQGDAICFVSHKYHQVGEVVRGRRKSLVLELWQGGVGHTGR